ncbi:MAG: helix-turn-helix transcriptional regulator [Candidatus Zixiibacteriota bacterium]
MNKYNRMLHILNLLRSRRNLNAQRLANECNVTERSIYRDIISLSEMNVPIYYDNGYKLASDNFLPPLNFTLDEYQLLQSALESTPLIKTNRFHGVYKSVKAKVESCLSDRVIKEKRYNPKTTHIEIPISSKQDKGKIYFTQIENAISACKTLLIDYESINSGKTKRKVDPYFIIFRGRAFYFVGYCHLRKEYRTFRINRIKNIEISDDIFYKKDDIDPHKYFENSWNVFDGEPVEVIVKFNGPAAKVVATSNHHPNETIKKLNDDEIIYAVVTKGIEEIQRWIIGFGENAQVLEPLELKENLSRIGKFLTNQYK